MSAACTTDPFTAVDGCLLWGATVISDVRDMALTRNAAEKQYASSCTGGRINRRSGHKDKFGTFTAYVPKTPAGTEDIEPFVEGDIDTLTLRSHAGQTLYNEGAIIISAEYGVPVEGGDLVEINVSWGRVIDP